MKVFLDANVLFAAAYNPNGLCKALFQLAEAGLCQVCASPFAIDEARRNLVLKSPAACSTLESLLGHLLLVCEPPADWLRAAAVEGLPTKDAPILAAAAASHCDLLVTGDRRHFGPWYGKTLCGVPILPPSDAFDQLLP